MGYSADVLNLLKELSVNEADAKVGEPSSLGSGLVAYPIVCS